jgi:hypothetical protein
MQTDIGISTVVDRLSESDEPAIRYKAAMLRHDPDSAAAGAARAAIPASPRVRTLLAERDDDGHIPRHPYAKWDGAHWVLAALADLGYPPGDESLRPMLEQTLGWLLSKGHRHNIPIIAGRARRCASQESNALFAALALGLADEPAARERADRLAADLIGWQWPDGGWNCDRRPAADTSSFMESLIPLRALALHARLTGSSASRAAAERAADIFLSRRLFRRRSDGEIMDTHFVQLHYPCFWHYDILFALKVMAEAGYVGDPRCAEALDLLASKRLADGGFPAEAKYYRVGPPGVYSRSTVDWGGTSRRQMNEFVTAEALFVLRAAGRE